MKRLVGSVFGLGFLPVAPGTWASAATVLVFLGAWRVWPEAFDGGGSWWIPAAAAAVLALGSIVSGTAWEKNKGGEGESDPRWFVLDELAGQSVALMGTAGPDPLTGAVISFVFFRIFDIIKPWPVKRLEALPGGWGITADDVAAGLLALATRVVLGAARVWLWP